MKAVFFSSKEDKAIIEVLTSEGNPQFFCGENPMEEVSPNVTDGAHEKHVPDITVEGNKVTVKIGSVPHPMLPEHYIEWIYLLTQRGSQRVRLSPAEEPVAVFHLANDDKPIAAYEYCNLHGLWKASV